MTSTKSESIDKNSNELPRKYGRRRNRPDTEFELTTYFQETNNTKIYAVEFCNHLNDDEPLIFATCGSNVVTIYECCVDSEINLLQCYADPRDDELYYTCCWSLDEITSRPILAVAGLNRIIRIINPTAMSSSKHFIGHGEAINELKFHPKIPSILLSASKDYSIRLWNIESEVCVAIFGGADGHKSQVLSADFNLIGSQIATSGMDCSVKIWYLDKPLIQEAIEASLTFDRTQHGFKTIVEHFPDCSVCDIHNKFVDCVKWMGNLILSKTSDNSIVCWKPGVLGLAESQFVTSSSSSIIRKFEYDCGPYSFVRFSMDTWKHYMALGNDNGTTFVWQLNEDESAEAIQLTHPSCTATVRDTAFSSDSKVLITVCDDGTVWRWNKKLIGT